MGILRTCSRLDRQGWVVLACLSWHLSFWHSLHIVPLRGNSSSVPHPGCQVEQASHGTHQHSLRTFRRTNPGYRRMRMRQWQRDRRANWSLRRFRHFGMVPKHTHLYQHHSPRLQNREDTRKCNRLDSQGWARRTGLQECLAACENSLHTPSWVLAPHTKRCQQCNHPLSPRSSRRNRPADELVD